MNKFNYAEMREKYSQVKPLHPLANVFPWIEEKAFRELVDDIHNNGLQQKIVTLKGAILDGKNRELACLMAGKWSEDIYREWDGTDNLIEAVGSLNLHRRHLSESQRAKMANQLWPTIAKEIEQEKANSPDPNSRKFAKHTKTEAVKQAAAMANVSPRTVNDAEFVGKYGTPEQNAAVDAGELAVSTAVKQIKAAALEAQPASEEPPVLEVMTALPAQVNPGTVEKIVAEGRSALGRYLTKAEEVLDGCAVRLGRCVNPLKEDEAIRTLQWVIDLKKEEMQMLRSRLYKLSKSLQTAQQEQKKVKDHYHPLIEAWEAAEKGRESEQKQQPAVVEGHDAVQV
jgi:hypothetical protein